MPVEQGLALNRPSSGADEPILLWSAGAFLKYQIQERYYRQHYCWCSPVFEAASLGRFDIGAEQAPSSDPATIYRQLHAAVTRPDGHDPKIASYKKSMRAIAIQKHSQGLLSEDDRNDIIAMVQKSPARNWRPVMYVIPYAQVADRVQRVPMSQRAGNELEYIIPDLTISEFHLIEMMPCP